MTIRSILSTRTIPILVLVQVLLAPITAQTFCSSPPPGIQKMFRGVDITKLDLVPLNIGSNGFRGPVLDFTCEEQKTWTSSGDTKYQLPDQVWQLTTLPGGWLTANANLYKSYKEVRKSMATEVGGEGSIWMFAFSASASFKEMQNTITNTSRYISDVGAFESATRADLVPSFVLGLDRFCKIFLDTQIKGTFQTNPNVYNRFINTFGTHYFSSANFGGYIRAVMETKSDYFYSSSESEAKYNAKASFLNIISANGGRLTSTANVDQAFSSSTTQTVRYYGGNTNLLTKSGISEWQPTVQKDPWLFSGELKPLSDLITDDVKRISMEKAVENYVLKSYLEELERLLAHAKVKFKDNELESLQTRVNTMKILDVLVMNDVEILGRDIEAQIVVPEWFLASTKLCYKWWPDGDPGQCGGVPNLLCARPNTMTPFYRDDTDRKRKRRPGGCRMQWGIHSTGYPAWFNDVRVCYRWYPDENPGECGGGAARLLCAGINQFSPEYRDDTDIRSGGCRMSWRIEVPSSAPVWMRAVKLCYSWYPDGDAFQCNFGSPFRDFCAVANEWTEYYRDDTYRRRGRPGGCRMSWGLQLTV
ncbi:perivitellin-2 67 kDa subunit [Biomphalaria pfeifferi]|uniref:Perivitellin-2 67 kDa subunit n=1 Tax=Biomphalaria pfeifferi TaxID=112525 RepID=A0AAD8BVB7_BIOPF|nr:perivitellin-2 67 kDa subunit [Biomphalaria pfeifferi]